MVGFSYLLLTTRCEEVIISLLTTYYPLLTTHYTYYRHALEQFLTGCADVIFYRRAFVSLGTAIFFQFVTYHLEDFLSVFPAGHV